jgi:hypothetical protein
MDDITLALARLTIAERLAGAERTRRLARPHASRVRGRQDVGAKRSAYADRLDS